MHIFNSKHVEREGPLFSPFLSQMGGLYGFILDRGLCNLLASNRGASVFLRTEKEEVGAGGRRGFKRSRESEFGLPRLLPGRKPVSTPKHQWGESPNQEKWQTRRRGRSREMRARVLLVP